MNAEQVQRCTSAVVVQVLRCTSTEVPVYKCRRYRCRDGVEVRGAKGIQSSCRCSSAVVHRIRAGTEVVQWSKDGAEEMVLHR